jgi:hypothetical protein
MKIAIGCVSIIILTAYFVKGKAADINPAVIEAATKLK